MQYTRRQIRKMIQRYLSKENMLDSDNPDQEFEYHALAAQCSYSFIENYCTAIPGWRVDLLFVVFDLENITAFIIEDGELKKLEQDTASICEHCTSCPLVDYEVRKIR